MPKAIMVKCVHHWLIESPNGRFSLAKCKKCGEYDAMPNSMTEGVWAQALAIRGNSKRIPIVRDDTERTTFLQEKIKEDKEKIKKELILQETLEATQRKRVPIQYTNAVKIRVLLDLMKGKTITETSKINKVPTSTIHGWRKTYSNYPKVKTSGDIEIFKKIIIKKFETENNLSSIARDYDIPRRTLRDWIKK